MIIKKKEIIAAALVVLVGMAGYLNWSYQDTIRVKDNDSYIETGKKLGEAQYVNSVAENEEESTNEDEETASVQEAETEEESPEATESSSGEAAVETASDNSGDYFEKARLDKETSRSKSLEILNDTAANESFDNEIRKKAGDKIIAEASNVEKENEVESIAQSKGYSEICVYVNDDKADIIVRKDNFGQEDVVKLTEIATGHLGVRAGNIKIIEVK